MYYTEMHSVQISTMLSVFIYTPGVKQMFQRGTTVALKL